LTAKDLEERVRDLEDVSRLDQDTFEIFQKVLSELFERVRKVPGMVGIWENN
jgi:hypothetical protein